MKCLFRSPHAHRTGVVVAVTAAIAMLAAAPVTASAALVETGACDSTALIQPFQQWGDSAQYKLVPGGSFESGAAPWKLTGGAAVVSGSEPFGATGSVGSRSLYIPAGASAESPSTCVNAAYPTFRLFARNSNLLSTVAVQVLYDDPIVGRIALAVGSIALGTSWRPTPAMLTTSAIQGVLNNGEAQVSLRFTSLTGSTTIDDVFVDPRLGH